MVHSETQTSAFDARVIAGIHNAIDSGLHSFTRDVELVVA